MKKPVCRICKTNPVSIPQLMLCFTCFCQSRYTRKNKKTYGRGMVQRPEIDEKIELVSKKEKEADV